LLAGGDEDRTADPPDALPEGAIEDGTFTPEAVAVALRAFNVVVPRRLAAGLLFPALCS